MTTYTCTVCVARFTSAKAAQRHARGRGHVVLVDGGLDREEDQ